MALQACWKRSARTDGTSDSVVSSVFTVKGSDVYNDRRRTFAVCHRKYAAR